MRERYRLIAGVLWFASGLSGSLGFASMASVGLGLLAVAAVAGFLASRADRWSTWWAALIGCGAGFVILGALALPWHSCTSSTPPPDISSCGGIHPLIFLAIALITVAWGLAQARRDRGDPPHG